MTAQIPETGEEFETVLGNGCYLVGVHIPERTYTGELVIWSVLLSAFQRDYFLYETCFFGPDPGQDAVTGKERLWLCNGEIVQISDGVWYWSQARHIMI